MDGKKSHNFEVHNCHVLIYTITYLRNSPELTWRDVQHIITQGAMIPNVQQSGWHINGAGFHLNHRFGFGVLDAGKMVELALTWEKVSEQLSCEIPLVDYNM